MGNHSFTPHIYGAFRSDIPSLPGHSPELMYTHFLNHLYFPIVALKTKTIPIRWLMVPITDVILYGKLGRKQSESYLIIGSSEHGKVT